MMGKRAPPSPSSRSDMHLSDDVPAVSLADPDSRFVDCCGLSVHYKEAAPLVQFFSSYLQFFSSYNYLQECIFVLFLMIVHMHTLLPRYEHMLNWQDM